MSEEQGQEQEQELPKVLVMRVSLRGQRDEGNERVKERVAHAEISIDGTLEDLTPSFEAVVVDEAKKALTSFLAHDQYHVQEDEVPQVQYGYRDEEGGLALIERPPSVVEEESRQGV